MQDEQAVYVAASKLEAFATDILRTVGLSDANARTVAWALITANLEGMHWL